MFKSPNQSIIETIARCFDDATYSDLTIKCRDKTWNVHRVIVCSQSNVLHAACMGGFEEAYTGVINLEDDDPIPVEIMLKYFYTGSIEEQSYDDGTLRLQAPVLTYVLADKYNVPTLMGLAKKRFESMLSQGATTPEFLSVVSDVYTNPAPTSALRAITANHARAELRDMMQSADLELLQATLAGVPEFAFDVLQLFANTPLKGYCMNCGPNQTAKAIQARCLKCGKGGISVAH